MSEHIRTPLDARFAADIATIIEPSWVEFETLTQRPGVQQFAAFASRYRHTGDWEGLTFTPELDFMRFDPAAEHFEPAQVAELLDSMNTRLDEFMQGLIDNYCAAKNLPVPGPEDLVQASEILSKIMVGGVEKVHAYMDYPDEADFRAYEVGVSQRQAYMPFMLFMMAGRMSAGRFYEQIDDEVLEAAVSQEEIDEMVDATMQESCARIRNNQKHVVPKAATAGGVDRLYAGTMNTLRTLYHQGSDQGFKAGLTDHFVVAFDPRMTDPDNEAGDLNDPAIRYPHQRRQFDAFAEHFNAIVGTNFTYPGPQRWDKQLIAAYAQHERFDADGEYYVNSLFKVCTKIYSTHGARHFVDAIADGRMKYSDISRAMMHLRQRPLGHFELPSPEQLASRWVGWEILPSGMLEPGAGEHGVPPDMLTKPTNAEELSIDWRRIERLRGYQAQWGGSAYFARTNIPGIPPEKQYYAVILPQQLAGGSIIEHAIADHPEEGNGLYAWRAERGFMRDPTDSTYGITWREVLANKRLVARQLGARCLYHTNNLAYNIMEYITAPPDRLLQYRFAVGRGAVRMARMARQQ